MSNPSLGWQKLQDVYYYLRPCYESINWSISNLQKNYRVSISSQTTLLALSSKHALHPSIIDIYTVSGVKLTSIAYNSGPTDFIVDYAFKDEDLIVVLSSRKFRYYKDLQGNFNEYDYTSDLIKLKTPSLEAGDGETDSNGSENEESEGIVNLQNNSVEVVYEVLESKIWGNFLVLKMRHSFIITDLKSFSNYSIPFKKIFSSSNGGSGGSSGSNSYSNSIHCIDLLSLTEDSLTLLVNYDISVFTIKIDLLSQEFEVTDEGLTEGPFDQISSSPNGMLVSLYNEKDSKIFVINNKFDQVLLEYDTSNEIHPPSQVAWCGNDAIILSLRDELKLIGPAQKSISFYYDLDNDDDLGDDYNNNFGEGNDISNEDDSIYPILKSEIDGLKVFTSSKVEFLSRVPESSINLYQIGSSSPSSILLDCIDKLSQHSPKADTNISLLKSDKSLELAMNECLQASLEEFQPYWQKKLLRAVSFGKIYAGGSYDADEYLQIVAYLKVLNQVRSSDIGIFITYKELLDIGWAKVIDMLLKRNLHFLALKIIGLIKEDKYIDKVYIHWCCYKITKELNMSDQNLFKVIAKKLQEYSKSLSRNGSNGNHGKNLVSVDEISEISYQEGRVELCKLLINLEPSILKKITSFINLGDLELALLKSFQTGDFDMCKLTLLKLQDSLTPVQFFKILNQNEQREGGAAGGIVDTSASNVDEDIVDFLHTSDDKNLFIHGDLINNFWVQSIGVYNKKLLEMYYKMEGKSESYQSILRKDDSNVGEESRKDSLIRIIHSSSTPKRDVHLYELELKVLQLQLKLSETYQNNSFLEDESLIQVITRLVKMNQTKVAVKVARDFKVSKEKLWWITLDVLTKAGEFDTLYQFVTSSSNSTNSSSPLNSPIGFKPIVERCLAFHAPPAHLSVYIKNCTNIHYSEKIELFIKNKDLLSASAEAFKFKDIEFLKAIHEKANREANTQVANTVKSYISRLGY